MPRKTDVAERVIAAAMSLAAERGWRELSLAQIAQAAELPLSEIYPEFTSKQAILGGLMRRVDAAVLAEEDQDPAQGSARDRLFDVIMRRFDALQPYKAGLGNVIYDQCRDPLAVLCTLPRLYGSMALMLESARLSAEGPTGCLRVKGLTAIYLATLRDWLRDDSEDLAKTMACLDRRLARADDILGRLPRCARRRSSEGPSAMDEPAQA
jgi:AcrR family transcriptional regulator